ncbi:Uncharacterised protein [Mycobacteroides abscessus]|nr:Uncharacterised protein [Mycobacteroides abscessus]
MAVCSAKIVDRICRIVSSRSETVSSMRVRAFGSLTSGCTLMSVMADAKRRWMTTSCRSRAIRSRSSSTPTCFARP